MLVSHRYKFIWIKNKRVAGTSIESFLQKYCLSPEEEKVYIPKHDADTQETEYGIVGKRMNGKGRLQPHMSARHIRDLVGCKMFGSYKKICAIRNPWEKVPSLVGWPPRDSFLKKARHIKKSADWGLYTINDIQICDMYIRFESLMQDLEDICRMLGMRFHGEIPRWKKRKDHGHYSELYNDESKSIVSKAYAKEIETFGYTFDG